MHPTELDIDELLSQCEIRFTRRGGPGGQHRNKVSTAAVIKHLPTGVTAEASERRSQAANRAEALRRLRVQLAREIREPVVSRDALIQKYGGSSLRVSLQNDDFATVIADVLNHALQTQGEVAESAQAWQTTSSQVIRLLKQDPSILELVNRLREENSRHRLK